MSLPASQRYDRFLPDVLTVAPGCLNEIALREIARAFVDLCERGRVWQAEMENLVDVFVHAVWQEEGAFRYLASNDEEALWSLNESYLNMAAEKNDLFAADLSGPTFVSFDFNRHQVFGGIAFDGSRLYALEASTGNIVCRNMSGDRMAKREFGVFSDGLTRHEWKSEITPTKFLLKSNSTREIVTVVNRNDGRLEEYYFDGNIENNRDPSVRSIKGDRALVDAADICWTHDQRIAVLDAKGLSVRIYDPEQGSFSDEDEFRLHPSQVAPTGIALSTSNKLGTTLAVLSGKEALFYGIGSKKIKSRYYELGDESPIRTTNRIPLAQTPNDAIVHDLRWLRTASWEVPEDLEKNDPVFRTDLPNLERRLGKGSLAWALDASVPGDPNIRFSDDVPLGTRWRARAIYKPRLLDANSLPLEGPSAPGLLDEYQQTIVDGALARILSLPGMDWTDEARGRIHAGRFEDAVSRHRVRATGRSPGRAATVRYRDGFATAVEDGYSGADLWR